MKAVIFDPTGQMLASAEFARSPMVDEIIRIDKARIRTRYRVTGIEWLVHHKRLGITAETSLHVFVSEEPE